MAFSTALFGFRQTSCAWCLQHDARLCCGWCPVRSLSACYCIRPQL